MTTEPVTQLLQMLVLIRNDLGKSFFNAAQWGTFEPFPSPSRGGRGLALEIQPFTSFTSN